jgi:hypothetical protein
MALRFTWLLFLALILSSCSTLTKPADSPRILPVVTWGMANEYFWTDEEKAVIRQAMEDINVSCGRELMRENLHTPAVTLHNKKLAFFEAELIGEGILGLADPATKSAAFYPMAFLDLDMLRSVAIHEVFHLLGLRHTNEPGSIMRPYMEAGETISRYDVRSLNGFGWQCK